MSKPTHLAYVVAEPQPPKNRQALGDERARKPIWRPVGAVWPHEKGGGFDVVIHPQLSVSGRIVCTERKDKPEGEGEAAA